MAPVWASGQTWTGSAGDGRWSTPGNWTSPPAFNSSTNLLFTTSGYIYGIYAQGQATGSVTFAADAPNSVINGSFRTRSINNLSGFTQSFGGGTITSGGGANGLSLSGSYYLAGYNLFGTFGGAMNLSFGAASFEQGSYTLDNYSIYNGYYVYFGQSSQTSVRLLAGSSFSCSDFLSFGDNAGASATMTQSGGTVSSGYTVLGWRGSGQYNLSSGSLSTNSLYAGIDGTGSFVQTGGTVVTNGLYVSGTSTTASRGFYSISGGSLTVNGPITVQNWGSGTFVQTGGTVSAQSLSLGDYAKPSNYFLSGGTLSLGNIYGPASTSGTVTFNGGTLVATGSADSFGNNVVQLVSSGGAIIDTQANSVVLASPLLSNSATGGLTKLGTGTLYLFGNSTYSGPTTVISGTLQLGTASTSGAIQGGGAITVASGATLAFSRSDNLTFSAPIYTGAGGLTQVGPGTLTVSGTQTYTGPTVINGGTLELSSLGNVGGSTSVTVNSGTLRLSRNDAFGSFTSTATPQLTINTSGTLASNGSFTTLVNAVLNGGAVVLNGGSSASFPAFGFKGTVAVSGSAPSVISAAAGTNNAINIGSTATPGSTVFAVADVTGDANPDLTIGVPLQNTRNDANTSAQPSGLIKTGAGTLLLTGVSTFTGGTTINAGTLQLGTSGTSGSGTLSGNGPITVLTGATLLGGVTDALGFLNNLSNNTIFLSPGATLSVVPGARLSIDRNLSLTGATLTSQGTGDSVGSTFLFRSSQANTISAASASDGTPSVISAQGVSMQNISTFNVGRGPGTYDLLVSSTLFDHQGTAGGLTKAGNGIMILTGANTYTLGTTVNGGTLQLGNGGTTGSVAGNIVVNSGGTLAFSRSNSFTFPGVISGAGSVVQSGSGVLTFTAAQTYTGPTTISAGVLELSAAGTTPVLSAITVTAGGTLRLSRNDTWGGSASTTSAAVTINAGGTVASNGTFNTLVNLTLNGGTLLLSGGFSISAYPTFALKGTVTVSGSTPSSVSTTGAGVNNIVNIGVTATPGATVFNVADVTGDPAPDLTVSVPLQNNVKDDLSGPQTSGLTKAGAGTMLLSAVSTYTGPTTLNAGTLQLNFGGPSGPISGSGPIIINSSATLLGRVTDSLGYLNNSNTNGVTVNYGGTLSVVAGSRLSMDRNVSLVGGTITSQGVGDGNGAFLFRGTQGNTFSATSFTDGTPSVINAQGVSLSGNIPFNVTRGAGAIDLLISSQLFDLATTTGSVTKSGNGILVLSGNNTYTGPTTVNAGILQIGNGGTTGSVTSAITVAGASGIVFNRSDNASYAGVISGAGAVTKLGTGTLTFTGALTYTGSTTVSAGTLRLGNGGTTGSILSTSGISVAPGAALAFNRIDNVAYAAPIFIGPGGLIQMGPGFLTFIGPQTYTGPTTISGGVLDLALSGTTPISNVINVNSGGTLRFSRNDTWGGSSNTLSPSITIFAGGTVASNGFFNTLVNLKFNGGTLLLNGGATAAFPAFSLKGTVAVTGSTPSLISAGTGVNNSINIGVTATQGSTAFDVADVTGNSNADLTVAVPLQDTRLDNVFTTLAGGLTKLGAGTMALSANNTYTGPTTVNAGTLQLGAGSNTGSIGSTSGITVAGGATLALNRSDNLTYSSPIFAGAGGLAQMGPGTLTFTSAQSYTGPTTVNAGTLQLGNGGTTGSISSSSAINVLSGATLAVNRSDSFSFTSPLLSGAGGLTQMGPGTLTFTGAQSYTGPTTVTGGTLRVVRFGTGAVSVASGAVASVTFSGTPSVSVIDSLSLTGTARLDLTGNTLIVRNTPFETIRQYVSNWYAGGARNGLGLGTSLTSNAYTTLAVFTNSVSGTTYFPTAGGVTLQPSDVIIDYAYVGDTNLDGVLDGQDYRNVYEGYYFGLSGWNAGDLDNSGGPVTAADLNLFLQSYAAYRANPVPLAALTSESANTTYIPEPGSIVAPLLGAAALQRRSRVRR